MKYLLAMLVIFCFIESSFAQTLPLSQPVETGIEDKYPERERWYDEQKGAQFFTGNDIFSAMGHYYTVWQSSRYFLGVSGGVVRVSSPHQAMERIYARAYNRVNWIIPVYLALKLYPLRGSDSRYLYPYIIAGFGPTLGLNIVTGKGLFDSFQRINGRIGGGGYVGLGVEYFWAEEWQIFADVRFQVFHFPEHLDLYRDYRGVTFSIGFSYATGF